VKINRVCVNYVCMAFWTGYSQCESCVHAFWTGYSQCELGVRGFWTGYSQCELCVHDLLDRLLSV